MYHHAEHLQVISAAQVCPEAAAVNIGQSVLHRIGLEQLPLLRFLWSVLLVEVEKSGPGQKNCCGTMVVCLVLIHEDAVKA